VPHGRVLPVLKITVGGFELEARLEEEAAPKTIAALRKLLPLESQLVQARWSGEAAWVPMGFDLDLGLGPENANSYPAAGELLLYPGGLSEVEILFPYGATCFANEGVPLGIGYRPMCVFHAPKWIRFLPFHLKAGIW